MAGVPDRVRRLKETAAVAATGLAYAKRITEEDRGESSISEEEAKKRAERCKYYWEVERHCFQKMEERKRREGESGRASLLEKAVPSFLGVFYDDGSESKGHKVNPGYGLMEEQKKKNSMGGWFSSNGDNARGHTSNSGHRWMVFECVKSNKCSDGEMTEGHNDICALTLLDAMEVSFF